MPVAALQPELTGARTTNWPDYCVERLAELLDLGLNHLVFVTASRDAGPIQAAEGNERLAAEVLAHLR